MRVLRIPLDAQSILFQQFRRTVSAEEQTGWGLGLFLAKVLLKHIMGRLK
jgi:K+-sensing histidine kinase KdpD